mmetsp:Transcript_41885/g.106030  ORF Transcript_41885/g.106030 Transcript_41885/m.106030 type:complete len:308 (+) Transcript_41885:2212-3135(+)
MNRGQAPSAQGASSAQPMLEACGHLQEQLVPRVSPVVVIVVVQPNHGQHLLAQNIVHVMVSRQQQLFKLNKLLCNLIAVLVDYLEIVVPGRRISSWLHDNVKWKASNGASATSHQNLATQEPLWGVGPEGIFLHVKAIIDICLRHVNALLGFIIPLFVDLKHAPLHVVEERPASSIHCWWLRLVAITCDGFHSHLLAIIMCAVLNNFTSSYAFASSLLADDWEGQIVCNIVHAHPGLVANVDRIIDGRFDSWLLSGPSEVRMVPPSAQSVIVESHHHVDALLGEGLCKQRVPFRQWHAGLGLHHARL